MSAVAPISPAILVKRREMAAEADFPPSLHPVLRRIYAGRAVGCALEVECSLEHLLPPETLPGCTEAAVILHEVIAAGGRILIVGDFDADGATSCALAMRALRAMGADARYLVPNRFEYGYGLTPEIVVQAAHLEPALIVTVDNGISSIEGVRAARALGIRVLVTDHHLPGAELPEAEIIVNPNQRGDTFPSKHLAGVGVIFYVMMALRRRLRDTGWLAARGLSELNLANLLDLVALGTVADVAVLDRNNRILVAQGLARIRRGQCSAGIRALIEVAKRKRERLSAGDLGFALAPRLNAAGRLEDMSLGIECLLSDSDEEAREMAICLDDLNQERRRIERDMQEQALVCLDATVLGDCAQESAVSVSLYHEDWHQGVIGILASRIKERTHRPTICFAPAGEGEIKGSARSIAGLHIRDCLEAVAVRHPGLILKFGGHAMAAGLSLRAQDFPAFSAAFEEEVHRHLDPADLHGVIYSDGELSAEEISLDLAQLLHSAGPWGQGFPEPTFDGDFEVKDCRLVGERHLKLILSPPGSAAQLEAIAFNREQDRTRAAAGGSIHIVYRLDVNEFRGRANPQLVIEHISA
ncbi:MAG: single-stranded-DNA-specific exonuclease RecJ [Chromatiales bacterium]|jgi:single-stranded-DNA-specific exonuclease|nr:single-stranded-DNA-specific exonuclease RecJ [Chromatiales bacterium]